MDLRSTKNVTETCNMDRIFYASYLTLLSTHTETTDEFFSQYYEYSILIRARDCCHVPVGYVDFYMNQ